MDSVLYWNAVALECNRFDHTGVMAARNQRGPTLSSRALAIVHIAMHDAYVLARRGLGSPPAANDVYIPNSERPAYSHPGGSTAHVVGSAVAGAASVTLLDLFPAQSDRINDAFAAFSGMGADAAGHRFGSEVGRAILRLRANDGVAGANAAHMDSAAYGSHREDPLNRGQGFLGVRYGFVRPFAITKWHKLAKYPEVGGAQYLADHREVRDKGAHVGYKELSRTPEETLIGVYWAYDGVKEIGTPPREYNQIVRKISEGKSLTEEQNARLFLLVNVCMADAGIEAWFWKYHFDLWRPIIGIREIDHHMGPAAIPASSAGTSHLSGDCDPFWHPLGAPKTNCPEEAIRSFTPPFPAYPSGHATFGAAAFHSARIYLSGIGKGNLAEDGTDDVSFDFVSDEMNGSSIDPDNTIRARHLRHFDGLHQAIYENSISRIFLGVHWRFDGTSARDAVAAVTATDQIGGVTLGVAIANDIASQTNLAPSPASVRPPAFDATP
ncbi:vanadium-dependent haloperoxidase [Sphingomonas citri]